MVPSDFANVVINPDYFLDAENGRVWTPERNTEAWAHSYEALKQAIRNAEGATRVVLVCGIQGSGKTAWIASQPASATNVYFDAALPGVRHRALIVSIATQLDVAIDAVWINTPLETALHRNALRPSDEIVPISAIYSVAHQFEEPTTAEGFNQILIVSNGSMSS